MPTPGTNNATPPARKPAKDRKPKAAPRALSPQDALAILQSALRECQLAGITLSGANHAAGYILHFDRVHVDGNALHWREEPAKQAAAGLVRWGDGEKPVDNMDVKESTHGTD